MPAANVVGLNADVKEMWKTLMVTTMAMATDVKSSIANDICVLIRRNRLFK